MFKLNSVGSVRAWIVALCLAGVVSPVDAQVAGHEASRIRWRSGEVATTLKAPQEAVADLAALSGNRADQKHLVVQFDGPVTDAKRAELRAAGLSLLNYVGDNAYFAAFDDAGINQDALRDVSSLRASMAIQRDWKLHPSLIRDEIHAWAIVNDNKAPGEKEAAPKDGPRIATANDETIVAVYVLFHPDVKLETTARGIVRSHGGRVHSLMRSINGFVVEMPAKNVKALAGEDAVQYMEPPLPQFSEMNDSNRIITGANTVQAAPYNLDGSGVSVLVYDGGEVLASHPDFGGRATVRDTSGVSDHSTHVAGTVGGNGAGSSGQYRGMAPGVTIESYGFEQPGGLSPGFLYTDPGDLEADYDDAINTFGADISNNSIGTNTAPNGYPCEWTGDYGVTAALIDAITRGSLGDPMRIVWANGNERQTTRCGDLYNTTAPPAGAKNHITVGALNSNNDSVTSFTSWGPVDDGRIKPDVSGPGCQSDGDNDVTSTSSSGGYTGKCGTSMAAPTIAGLSALLLQDYRVQYPGEPDFRNSTLKAMLANTAQDIEQVGPDYKTGYGSVRIEPAINLMRAENFVEDSVLQGDTYSVIIVVSPGDPELKVTLAWDDVPGTPNVDPALVNDLDLQVFDPNGVRHFPWTLDPLNPATPAVQNAEDHINNIEQVFAANPMAGAWRVDIVGFNVPQGPQPFSVAANPVLVNCSDAGIARFDRSKYACESEGRVTVIDCGLNTDDLVIETVSVDVASSTEPGGETLLLTETAAASAAFVATIGFSTTDAVGVVHVTAGDSLSVTYVDTDDGAGNFNVVVTDNAVIDCTPPVISNVQVGVVNPRDAAISFDSDELSFGSVDYGLSCGALTGSASGGLVTSHSFKLTGLVDDTTYFFSVSATDEAGNSVSDNNGGSCYTFATPEVPDYFSEQFAAGLDIQNSTITFTPNASNDFYEACVETIVALPTDPTGGTNVSLSDDGNSSFTPTQPVVLYGTAHSTVYINANGNLTFDASDSDYTETFAEHFGEPRIAAVWDDINPTIGGTISYKSLADRAVVTYDDVSEISTSNSNTFQIEMFYDGRITISYLQVDISDAIAGLSGGTGLDPDFLETDLSGVGSCGPRPPFVSSESLQTEQNTPLTIDLEANDDGLPDPPAAVTYRIETLPQGDLRDTGDSHLIASGDLPYTLVGGGNQVEYTPDPGYSGSDSFTFKANDGGDAPDGGDSTTGMVDIIVGGPTAIYSWPLDADPGWTTEDMWAYGKPQGIDGDPTGGFTGINVYGFNLTGEYDNNMSVQRLTTTVIDCSTVANAELRFQRWLGVESSTYDHAKVEVSNNGSTWMTIWDHSGPSLNESAWSLRTYDISAVADGQANVQIRWTMGTTDTSVTYHGWNIDDVEIWGIDTTACLTPGDYDADGDWDLVDLSAFTQCFGAGRGQDAGCSCGNLALPNEDIDVADWAVLSSFLGGP
jgi:hypothetical protein